METAEVLRKIKDICTRRDSCGECPLDRLFCQFTPESWESAEIEEMSEVIDNYKEEK